MENRALIALALSFVIFMVFMYLGEKTRKAPPPAPPVMEAKPAVPPPAPATVAPAKPLPAPVSPAPAKPAKEVVVDTPLYRAVFTEQGAALKSLQLKKYRESLPFQKISGFSLGPIGFEVQRYQDPATADVPFKEMVAVAPGQELPLTLTLAGKETVVPPGLHYEADRQQVSLKGDDTATVRFTGVTPQGLTVTRTYKFNAVNYVFDLEVAAVNQGPQAVEGSLELSLAAGEAADRKGLLAAFALVNNRLEEAHPGMKAPATFTGKVDWAVIDRGYFLMAMAAATQPKASLTVSEPTGTFLTATLKEPKTLAPGQSSQTAYTLYFGPKEINALAAPELGLERLVHFGWFDILAKPLLYLLNFIDRFCHNYGWSLVILTLLTRLVFWWPNHKSFKSMKEMQRLQPRVAQIREKYKDDREAMNRELMALYRTFKVNPLGGCLPMLLQLPVFIALYNILSYAIELRHAAFINTLPFTDIVWLADLSAKDPLLITPIVMGASMVIQQKMTPSTGDPTQAKMMMFMPIIFTFLFLSFASGLVIYWLVNNVLAIIQQYFTNKYLT